MRLRIFISYNLLIEINESRFATKINREQKNKREIIKYIYNNQKIKKKLI